MRQILFTLFLSGILVLSGCSQELPKPNVVDEPLITEQPLQTFVGEKMPVTLQLESSKGDLQAQATLTYTIEHAILVFKTTVKGQGFVKCPEIITYGKMRIVIYRYGNTASDARYVERPNFLTTFAYSSRTIGKASGKYCVDSTLNKIVGIGGSYGIIGGAWKAFCITVPKS